ncbi:Forkhead transcription factor [Thecaphora frezii]
MTTPSNSRLLGSSTSSNWTKGSSDYSPTSTSTPFATPATRATSIAPSTFSRSGPGNRRAKQLLLSSVSSIDGPRHNDTQASPTPIGSRSCTPASREGSAPANDPSAKASGSSQRNHMMPQLSSASSTQLSASASTSSAPPQLGKDADDFFARAQAMGLRLTREEYERTRAGITAFLRAERVPSSSNAFGSKAVGSQAKTDSGSGKDENDQALDGSPSPASGKSAISTSLLGASAPLKSSSIHSGHSHTPLGRSASGPSWTRNASSPMLSFFTAVVAPTASPISSRHRASLEETSSAEEKRRRKIRKMRLQEKREQERERQRVLGHSTLSTPNSSQVPPSSPEGPPIFQTPPPHRVDTAKDKTSSTGQQRRRIGLGLNFEESDGIASPLPSTPPELSRSSFSRRRSRGRTVSFDTSSPGDALGEPMRHCASLDDLSRRAWVSPRGKLHLLRSAIDPESVFPSPETEADASATAVFAGNAATPAGIPGVPADGWGARHRRESSGYLSGPEALSSATGRLGILDQIMAQQTSPRRLYKEAKQREKAERERRRALERERAEQAALQIAELAAKAELEAEAAKAADAGLAIKASNSDYRHAALSTPSAARRKRLQSGVFGMSTPLDASASRGARYVTGMTSPRNARTRMSTREHYDFVMHGISPGQPGLDNLESICNISNTPGPIAFSASWDAEPLSAVRGGNEAGKASSQKSAPVSATPFRSSLFNDESNRPELIGVSPSVAGLLQARNGSFQSSQSKLARSASDGLAVMSPLSGRLIPSAQSRIGDLDFDEDPSAVEDQIDSLPGMGQGSGFNPKRGLLFGLPNASPSLGMSHHASVESTLAQSPTAKGYGFLGSSPGRNGSSGFGTRLPFVSPRTALFRAHSGSGLESTAIRRLGASPRQEAAIGHKRKASQDAKFGASWSAKTSMEGLDTISPADVFGSALPQQASDGVARATKPPPEPIKEGHQAPGAEAFFQDDAPEADYTSDVEPSPRKKLAVGRRARSHSPQSPLKQTDVTASVLKEGMVYPSVQLDYGASTGQFSAASTATAHDAVGHQGEQQGVLPAAEDGRSTEQPELAVPPTKAAAKRSAPKSKSSAKGSIKNAKPSAAPRTEAAKAAPTPAHDFDQMASQQPSVQNGDEIGWDQPDGSRLVKLVSEELQAALESGTLEEEPPARYYLLPPGFGQSTAKPSSVSYAGLIGQAIMSSSDMRLSLAEIYAWISTTYPFFEKGDRGWQNSIRHNLSLNKSFVKIEREVNMPGKGGWWGIQSGHEDRFQNGMYNASGQKADASKSKASQKQAQQKGAPAKKEDRRPDVAQVMPVVADDAPLPAVNTMSAEGHHKKKATLKRKKASLAAQPRNDDSSDDSDDGDIPLQLAAARSLKRAKFEGASKVLRQPLAETQMQAEKQQPSGGEIDSRTPVRSQGSVYASSVAGSQHSRGPPMLTDSASSPPSSPFILMPPPTVQMTADHSALKRKLAAAQGDGQPGYSSGYSPSPFNVSASPLSGSVRSHAYPYMRGSALGGAFSFSGPMHNEVSGGSPLRRTGKAYASGNMLSSPKRLWSISSPVSSMRGSAKSSIAPGASEENNSGEDRSTDLPMSTSEAPNRSPNSSARMTVIAHSPIRSSPLRLSTSTFTGSPGRPVASSTSLQMQLGMGGSGVSNLAPFGHGVGMGMGMGMGMGLGSGHTPGHKAAQGRFASALSPIRRSLMSSSMHSHGSASQQHSSDAAHHQLHHHHSQQQPGWYLDDPFDVQSNLQHQMDYASQQMGSFGNTGSSGGGDTPAEGPTASPLRMMWNTIQAAGGVQAFTNSYHASHQQ